MTGHHWSATPATPDKSATEFVKYPSDTRPTSLGLLLLVLPMLLLRNLERLVLALGRGRYCCGYRLGKKTRGGKCEGDEQETEQVSHG